MQKDGSSAATKKLSSKKAAYSFSSLLIRALSVSFVSLAIVAFAPFAYDGWKTFANTITLAPILCTGDWNTSGEDGLPRVETAGRSWFCSFAAFSGEQRDVSSATLSLSFSLSQVNELREVAPEHSEASPLSEPEDVVQEEALSGEVAGAATSSEEHVEENSLVEDVEEEPSSNLQEGSEPEEESIQPEITDPISFFGWIFFVPTVRATEDGETLLISEELLEPVPEIQTLSEEVLPPDSEEPLMVEKVPARIALTYTTDGESWNYIDSFEVGEGEVRFPLELIDTNDIERLVIRLATEDVEQNVHVTLSNVSLELVTIPEVEEPQLVQIELPPILPEPRVYEREVVIDPTADHTCYTNPSSVELSEGDVQKFTIILSHGDSEGEEIVELGSMPYGIDLRFSGNEGYRFPRADRESKLSVTIKVVEGAQFGSMSIPIIYQKERVSGESVVTCQINVIHL